MVCKFRKRRQKLKFRAFTEKNRLIGFSGIQCDPYESLYVKTEQIVCKVDGPGTKEPRKGPVIVKVFIKEITIKML